MVVDDDVPCREALQNLLEEFGATVLVASDGLEALAVLESHTPDLVLSDIRMPRLDGYALVQQVRGDQAWAGLPMVAVSASFPAGEPAICGGFDGTVGKPFDSHDLDRTLRQVMLKRPQLLQHQCARLRGLATAARTEARDIRARASLLIEAANRRRATRLDREAA